MRFLASFFYLLSVYLVSLFYWTVVAINKKLYELGLFEKVRTKAYTISVGNIVAGGAGKTPFVLYLAELLSRKGLCGVVLRPYKALHEGNKEPVQVLPEMSAAQIGDEAALISRRLPAVFVWVGKKAAAACALDRSCPKDSLKYIIVDDGFQHFALERDCDIVIVDAHNVFGKGRLLRERPSALSRADLIVVNEKHTPCVFESVAKELRAYATAPLIHVRYKVDGFFDGSGNRLILPKNSHVALFCGLADPTSFTEILRAQGYHIVSVLMLQDHEAIVESRLDEFVRVSKARGVDWIVCTEKDIVKVNATNFPLCYLKIDVEVLSGEDLLAVL